MKGAAINRARRATLGLLAVLSMGAPAADGQPAPSAVRGDPARGRAIIVNRQTGLCLLCHAGPFPEERFQGNLGPSLAGVGARLSVDELRLRLLDPARFNPQTLMPAYARSEGSTRVAAPFRGMPLFDDAQIEDVVAFLATLR